MQERAFRRAFGHAIREARDAVDMSQRELAQRAGITGKYLSRLELGMATPSLFIASRLAGALEMSLDTLIGGARSPSAASATAARLLSGRAPEDCARAIRVLRALLR